MTPYEVETVTNNIIKSSIAVVEIDDLAIDVRGTDLLEAPFLELHHRGLPDQLLHHRAHRLVLCHYFFERFLIFHTVIMAELLGERKLEALTVVGFLILKCFLFRRKGLTHFNLLQFDYPFVLILHTISIKRF